MRTYLTVLLLLSLSGCFGRSNRDADGGQGGNGSGSGGETASSGGQSATGGDASGGETATGGMGAGGTSPFACGCLEGSDAGLVLDVEGGEEVVFSDPPRFHEPDTVDGITWLFECDDAETPIYYDSKCEFLDIVEACHAEEGCLQIQEDLGFKWLSLAGEVIYEGESTFEREYLTTGDDVSLDQMTGTLTDTEANFSATFVGAVCHLHRDDCLR